MEEITEEFERRLDSTGLHGAVAFLNRRTPYRFTGIYRYDGDTLRNVTLFDRWSPELVVGADAPMQETFCAIVRTVGGTLVVADGRQDARFPWMQANAVVSYCGALISNERGQPFGTICHFDLQPCENTGNELEVLQRAAPVVYRHLRDDVAP